MQSLFDLTKGYEIKAAPKVHSERAELLQNFLDRLNAERGNYKPLTAARLSMMLSDSQLKTNSDIYAFYRQCQNARHFSKFFWYSLRTKKDAQTSEVAAA